MAAQSRIMQVLLAPLFFWIALLAVGSYYMISFDFKTFKSQASSLGLGGMIKKSVECLSLTHVKKGIDLAGGTYLVLGLDLEAALDAKLSGEMRSFKELFASKNLRVLPSKQAIESNQIVLNFEDAEDAKICCNVLQEAKNATLRVSYSGSDVYAKLSNEATVALKTGAVEQAVSVLNNRLGSYGVEGIVVQQHGERQIVVQIPGVSDPERIKSLISQTAHLEFKVIESEGATREAVLDRYDGDLPSDKMIIPGRAEDGVPSRYYLVSAVADMTGDRIVDARADFDQYNKPTTAFKLDSIGAREFADLTANNVGRSLGIIIDGVVYSRPGIREAISGGSCSITGIGSHKEAADLAIVLKSGSLQAPIKFEQESRVGASLGQDAINAGIMSCIISLLVLFLFSLFFYKIPGLFAVLALLYNLFLILLFLSYFGATLTLPGIAGMVVTIGMAVDASILIYERIKEELRAGAGLRSAVNTGFQDAMVVILDSNITTFLTGVVLFYFGGPAIKGFAVTLMAGIIATVLAGVYFLKSLFTFIFDVFNPKSLKF